MKLGCVFLVIIAVIGPVAYCSFHAQERCAPATLPPQPQPQDVIPTPDPPVRYTLIPPLPSNNNSQDWNDGYVQGQRDYAEAFRNATIALHVKAK